MPLVETRAARPVLIRITPLIDVVFILLIFFMLTTRLSPIGALEVSSAESRGGGAAGEPLPRLHLQAPSGLQWNGEPSDREAVLADLERLRPAKVVVSTDPETSLTRFTQWQGRLAQRGITGQWRKNGATGAGQ